VLVVRSPWAVVTVVGRARSAEVAVGGIAAAIRAADQDLPVMAIGSAETVLAQGTRR
jgi:hypothetical protein